MTDRSELLAVPGVTAQDYARLEPWLCALPVVGKSPINVNTLRPEEAPLLVMLMQGNADPIRARAILSQKPVDGYGNSDDFFNSPMFASPGAFLRRASRRDRHRIFTRTRARRQGCRRIAVGRGVDRYRQKPARLTAVSGELQQHRPGA
jgi:type II secretory pathway component PulK